MSETPEPTPVALYARVSSDRQDVDLSVAAQLRALRDYSEKNGHVVVRVSYGFKVIKNYGLELTHRKAMASSRELLWRCLGRIAERWRRERDI